MEYADIQFSEFADLRRRANGLIGGNLASASRRYSRAEVENIVRDLQTHKIELELQNSDLNDALAALDETSEKYQHLYNQAPVGYITLDQKGVILDVNQTFCLLQGSTKEQLIGLPLSACIVAEDQDTYFGLYRSLARDKVSAKCQLRAMRKDSDSFWIELNAAVVGTGTSNNTEEHSRVVVVDISDRKDVEDTLAYQTTHDTLTGLGNRKEFESTLESILKRAQILGEEFGLCFIDLDQFKLINDTCGHQAGDELLKQISKKLLESIRDVDCLCRIGGDEFALIVNNCDSSKAQSISRKILLIINTFRFEWEEQLFKLGASIGLVSINATSTSVAEVMSCVDSACYTAKEAGRNRIHLYLPDNLGFDQRRSESKWVSRLHWALEEDRFCLWHQAIVPVQSGAVQGTFSEVLIRLLDEAGQLQLPGKFLPAAEKYGLSPMVDRWVVGAIVDAMRLAPNLTENADTYFINLSGASLSDELFLDYVTGLMADNRLLAKKLCFEITETATIKNLKVTQAFIEKLQKMGCRFALDDFGSGLSSFAYLRELPVDYLKIDGAFVKDITDNQVDQALVRAIHDVGSAMGKTTIAEFVENAEILEMLKDIGIDYAQGFGISLPKPLEF